MKNILVLIIFIFSFSTYPNAQENKIQKVEFKVFGNCGICKTRIEKSLKIKEVKKAKWNKRTKVLSVAYLSLAITLDSLQRRIAAVGHDTEKFKAPDSMYIKLPDCCLYRDNPNSH